MSFPRPGNKPFPPKPLRLEERNVMFKWANIESGESLIARMANMDDETKDREFEIWKRAQIRKTLIHQLVCLAVILFNLTLAGLLYFFVLN